MAAVTERVLLATPNVGGRANVIASPFQWLFTGEDNLRIVVVNSVSGVVVSVQGRFLLRDGRVQAFTFPIVPTADRMPTTVDKPLGDGFLLNLSAVVTSGAPLIGQTYCMIQIIRGFTGATILLGGLLGGYITTAQHLSYPGSPIESSISGGGVIRSFIGSDPGFQSNIAETVPTGARWHLLGISAEIVTGASAAARREILVLLTAAAEILRTPQPGQIPANTTTRVYWAAGMPHETMIAGDARIAGLPTEVILLAGDTIQTVSDVGMASDDWGAPVVLVREWLEAA